MSLTIRGSYVFLRRVKFFSSIPFLIDYPSFTETSGFSPYHPIRQVDDTFTYLLYSVQQLNYCQLEYVVELTCFLWAPLHLSAADRQEGVSLQISWFTISPTSYRYLVYTRPFALYQFFFRVKMIKLLCKYSCLTTFLYPICPVSQYIACRTIGL